jgi:hypothetical protein
MDEKQDATPSGPQAANAEPQNAQIVCSDEAKKLGGITGKGWMPGKAAIRTGVRRKPRWLTPAAKYWSPWPRAIRKGGRTRK